LISVLRGAHAPRVLASAPRDRELLLQPKEVFWRGAKTSTRGRVRSQIQIIKWLRLLLVDFSVLHHERDFFEDGHVA
jgi:hypothetical protein